MHAYPKRISLVTALWMLAAPAARAVTPTAAEIGRARDWAAARFGDAASGSLAGVPFSFTYGGKPSADLLGTWKVERRSRKLDDARTERTATWTDPAGGLILTCRAVEYADFPTVEWTLHFKNGGPADTQVLADILAIDAGFERPAGGEFTLHHSKGDSCTADSYRPYVDALPPGDVKQFAPAGGRPTNGAFPFWNVEMPGGGLIAVVGWPGQWSARLERDADRTLRIRGGQELARFVLHPGEEARSPLVALQFYDGDWIRGQNIWRRWMVAHVIPRPGGKLVPTHYAGCWSNDLQPRAETEIAILDGFVREGVKLDFWIIDAGWYPDGGSWPNTGTWEVDPAQFPMGIREVSDHARANGMKFVLWFEPERAAGGTWLTENHPEWVLGGKGGGLVNLGDPEAWKWVLERIDGLLVSQGIDAYRQDFNIDPLPCWRGADTPDRLGLTEMKHVMGYLAYWDELLRRHPDMWLDSCASGGRRNDLETLRRSVPLLRSDAFDSPITQQCHTYGLSLWVPYYGSGLGASDPYWFRSCIFPASRVGWDTRKKDLDYPLLRRMVAEFRRVERYLLGDYYPLTPYSMEKKAWIAWQFDRPEVGEGMVQAFRREDCAEESRALELGGLDRGAAYAVESLDTGKTQEMSGRDLMEGGLRVTIAERPGSALLVYRRARAK